MVLNLATGIAACVSAAAAAALTAGPPTVEPPTVGPDTVSVRAASAPAAGTAPDTAPDTRPNIVLISTDDQSMGDLWAMTRLNRRLASRGTSFVNSIAPFPLCCPDRASILTGQYAHNHGVLGNGGGQWPRGGFDFFDGCSTLATWLQDAGYQTAFVGKYLNNYGKVSPRVTPPGWTAWHATTGGGNYLDTRIFQNGVERRYPGVYQTDLYADISNDIIAHRIPRAAPLFLWTSYYAPHDGQPVESDDPTTESGRVIGTPAVADRHRDRFAGLPLPTTRSFDERNVSDKPADVRALPRITARMRAGLRELNQQRLEALLAVDEAVARTVRTLAESGELRNTLIIFTSDNGHLLGDHRVPQGKLLPYEPSLHVPLIIRGPGFPAGATRDQLVATTDLAPTITQAAGVTPDTPVDGMSLRPFARDPEAVPQRDVVIEAGPKQSLDGPMYYTGLRTERWTYVEYGNGETELYELDRDPYQLHSRHADPAYAAPRAALAARLAAVRTCRGRGCREPPAARVGSGRLGTARVGSGTYRFETSAHLFGGPRLTGLTDQHF